MIIGNRSIEATKKLLSEIILLSVVDKHETWRKMVKKKNSNYFHESNGSEESYNDCWLTNSYRMTIHTNTI